MRHENNSTFLVENYNNNVKRQKNYDRKKKHQIAFTIAETDINTELMEMCEALSVQKAHTHCFFFRVYIGRWP